jgi:hypothetical protein
MLLWLALTGAATTLGFLWSRFVRRRLRFVDAMQHPVAPVVAGAAAAVLAVPVAGLLPVVTAASGVLFGAGVAAGAATGQTRGTEAS